MSINVEAIVYWLSQPTKESLVACILLCLSPVLGLPACSFIVRTALFRSVILSIWEDDARIRTMRLRFEAKGIITEPFVASGRRCECCDEGIPMSLECDLRRKPLLFTGILTRCASCGRSPDRGPGETLEALAARYTS